jgi:CBS domain-containing protein
MFDTSVRNVMRKGDLLKGPPTLPVAAAAQRMAKKNVGAIVVMERDRVVGIFTERDIVFRVIARGLDPAITLVGDAMTRTVQTIGPDEPFGHGLLVMHDKRFRHLPVVENGKLVGIVSARTALDPELEEFVAEAQRRRHLRAELARRRRSAARKTR